MTEGSTGQQIVTKTTPQSGPGTLRAKPVEPSKLRNPTFRNPHIINQALMGGPIKRMTRLQTGTYDSIRPSWEAMLAES